MTAPDRLRCGTDVPPDIARQVAAELPDLAVLWRAGPLHLDRLPVPAVCDASAADWRTTAFRPGQSVQAWPMDADTLLIRATPDAPAGCLLETRDRLSIRYWGEVPWAVLYLAVIEAVRTRGGIMLHACGYVPPGQTRLTAVLGRSGSGKSTHLLNQLAAGARAVSEDMLWIDRATCTCSSTDKHVRLLPTNQHANTRAAASDGAKSGIKDLWQIHWSREASAPPQLGRLCCLEQYQPRTLSTLPRLIQVKHLWEALGHPVLPTNKRSYENWVNATVNG